MCVFRFSNEQKSEMKRNNKCNRLFEYATGIPFFLIKNFACVRFTMWSSVSLFLYLHTIMYMRKPFFPFCLYFNVRSVIKRAKGLIYYLKKVSIINQKQQQQQNWTEKNWIQKKLFKKENRYVRSAEIRMMFTLKKIYSYVSSTAILTQNTTLT